jgi:ATP/maltotriose-dependent transcriptional regulator MalT
VPPEPDPRRDDYHLIEADTVHVSLGFLLEHRPPGLHVVLASRADPPLSLARQRARGQLAEVRAAELRFTPEEAAGLLREAAGTAGRPNQEIAEELVVALSTVKKHVTHILGKLGAANRTEATARARDLGLLP